VELPGSFDFEFCESDGFAFGEFVFDDSIDAAAARAFVQFCAQSSEVSSIASGNDFDVSTVGVADPTAEIEFCGFAMHEPAKADALNPAANVEVKNHVEF
jgi:hypothetical protein